MFVQWKPTYTHLQLGLKGLGLGIIHHPRRLGTRETVEIFSTSDADIAHVCFSKLFGKFSQPVQAFK